MHNKASVLIVEDQAGLAQNYVSFLAHVGITATVARTGADALERIAKAPPDVVVLDVSLPGMDGIDVLRNIRRCAVATPIVVLTGNGTIKLAVEAMREGAFDFVVKPCSADRLLATVRKALAQRQVSGHREAPMEESDCDTFCGFRGRSSAMIGVYKIVKNAAQSTATVFVTGESGTGKELCAEALHSLSKRRSGPFISVNCAAIPHDLFESELFGHVKGAFTGATSDRFGAAMRANGGTLFLDEIGEMQPAFQAKMLRFIQTGKVQRIGDDRAHDVDVRIVCATNRDPKAEVAAGRFREDLFYRLYVIPIELPPLRCRGDDVLLLARLFLSRYAEDDGRAFIGFDRGAEEALMRYKWPGNIRELQNVVRKIIVLGTGPTATIDCLPREIALESCSRKAPGQETKRPASPEAFDVKTAPIAPLDQVVNLTIQTAISRCDGSIPRAAAALKVSPSTIYRRLQMKI